MEGARAAHALGRPGFPQPIARLEEVLRDHLDVGEHRHEVRIAGPPRDDVEMDVVGDTRAGDPAEVPAEVEAGRAIRARQDVDGGDGQTVDLERLVVTSARRAIRRGVAARP